MNPQVDDYLRKAKRWQEEMEKLRGILLGCQLTEEWKWGKPCYTFRERNVAIIQGFKESCALLFCQGALLKDPQGLLEKPGENTQAARRIPFTNVRDVVEREAILKAYIREAMEVERAGREVDFKRNPEPVPEELQSKFDEIPAVKAAFEALTPGRQRAYILHFSAPKQSKTRASRVEKWLPQILQGKGMNDGYLASKTKARLGAGEARPAKRQKNGQGVVLLSGGNPQIAKGDGDAPVQAYIAAMPGWKHGIGKRLDALIVRTLPDVRKAVRWNSPFYGVEGQGFFLGIHCLTKYVKVTFFQGRSMRPAPPGGTEKSKDARWIDIYEDDEFDEAQMVAWVTQAAVLPGWAP